MLHFGLNKSEYNLTNLDIEGSRPRTNKFKSIRAPTSPLDPVYQIQSFTYV